MKDYFKMLKHDDREGYVEVKNNNREDVDLAWKRRYFVLHEGILSRYKTKEKYLNKCASKDLLLSDVSSFVPSQSWAQNISRWSGRT